ncbi:MAG: alpha-glucan family phosphorylase [Adhaeribacter sp.]
MEEQAAPGHIDFIKALNEMALDLHWSWSHATDHIWKELDPVLWDLTHNPLVILQTISQDRIHRLLEDQAVRLSIEEFIRHKQMAAATPAWFEQTYPGEPLKGVAFFSMEFMLSEALPIYSGGLGNVAGDHLKSASDLGVPVTGVGLLYQQGYSRQIINQDGAQQALFPYNDPGQLPITPLRRPDGEWLRIEIAMPGYSVWLRTWQVQVGRVLLLLLDTNDIANFPVHRGITSELYGAGAELRLMQELVLGLGGWRLLKALGIRPEVCHLNEGHSAFVVLERARDFMEENEQSFGVALTVTRSGNIFTTHTAVGAGFDCFKPALIAQYLGAYAKERLHISVHELLALGRKNPADTGECFNTSFLAIRGSGRINAVSKLHGQVSRELFAPLFPRWPLAEVPVGHVTNGVHMSTWDSPEADALWTQACGKDRWQGTLENLTEKMRQVPDARIWEMRLSTQETFIAYVRRRYARQLALSGRPEAAVEEARHLFDPEVLTLGFARRFVAYKRTNLLLHDPERLRRIFTNPQYPVQLFIAGKAHPADTAGQALIKAWVRFVRQYELQHAIVFLSDYDMLLTEHLAQGVDVWINTPRRPWEACGTSGMKVLVNGGLNVSVLDGWWEEAYSPEVGWAIPRGEVFAQEAEQDAADAAALYDLLENEIIPEFYARNAENIPLAWVNRMRESMARLTPQYSANRSVREYTEAFYLPAARDYLLRAARQGEAGIQVVNKLQAFEKKWQKLCFGALTVTLVSGGVIFEVQVYLHGFRPEEVRVQLYAEGLPGKEAEVLDMQLQEGARDQQEAFPATYQAVIPAGRPAGDFTPRIIPREDTMIIPLEAAFILWQR